MQTPKRRRITNPINSPFANPKAVVQQHLKDGTDINQIVARARRGIAPSNVREPGRFIDVSNIPQDLTEAFNSVESAWESFMTLPAKAREELGNDPRQLSRAGPEFFKRHGMLKTPIETPEVLPPEVHGGKGGVPPKAAKPPKKAVSEDSEEA